MLQSTYGELLKEALYSRLLAKGIFGRQKGLILVVVFWAQGGAFNKDTNPRAF